jgi:hypothetical protein
MGGKMSEWPSSQELEDKVQKAIEQLLHRDRFLLERDVNERSISHKLASYLQDEFGNEWDVDCEYNRDHDIKKELTIRPEIVEADDTTATTVFPDIIVHRRGLDDNLLVIEMKKTTNLQRRAKDFDLDKLRAFRREKYHYQHTLYLQLKTGFSIGVDEMRWGDEAMP